MAFLPEIAAGVLAAGLLARCLGSSPPRRASLDSWMLMGSAVLVGSALCGAGQAAELFGGTYRIDLFSQSVKVILCAAFVMTVLLTDSSVSIAGSRRLEHHLFATTALLGMMMMASAVDWLTLFVAIELSSYSLYLLVALRKQDAFAEANVKYLLLGAAASGLLLWGISLVCGLYGSTALPSSSALTAVLWPQPAFRLGLFFIALALLFKLAAFPMHFWAPDAYQGASTPATQLLATVSKAAAVAVLIRFFGSYGVPAPVAALLGILAFVSMTLGNAVALVQNDFKRLMAYSSVSQAGYLLVGFLAGSFEGLSAALFYAAAYALMNTAVFLAAAHVARAAQDDNPALAHFDGLAEKSPFLALILLLGLLSLAGIPPLAGFTAKWVLFSAAMNKGHWFLVLWAVLNSVVSLFYYLTVVKHAYLAKPEDPAPIALDWGSKALGAFLFAALVGLGLFPAPVLGVARLAIASAFAL